MTIFSEVICFIDRQVADDAVLLCESLRIKYLFHENAFCVEQFKKDIFIRNLNEFIGEENAKNEEFDNAEKYSDIKITWFSKFFLLFFILFFIFTSKKVYFWSTLGGNDAYLLINGEFWRGITSLSLHADIVHLSSNLLFFVILLKPLIYFLGEGKAWFLVVLSGFIGNVIADYIYQLNHISIGFSTSVFGAIGILSVFNFYGKEETSLTGKLLPFGAALGLFAFTGIGKNVDVIAHFTGLISGVAVTLIYFKKNNFFKKSDVWFKIIAFAIFPVSWGIAVIFL
jgi:membrane associated rhomboid family serine protease